MAKKRVHEIAKERGISSKEVIAVLQRAGLDVKAAASSVDEREISMAFSNGDAGGPDRGATAASQPEAVLLAKAYVSAAIVHAHPMGRGIGPVHHLYRMQQQRRTIIADPDPVN